MVSAQKGQLLVGPGPAPVSVPVGGPRSRPQCAHFVASGCTGLRQAGHTVLLPAPNANAKPNGPNRTPNPNHKQPLAPRLDATNAAAMPQTIQIRIAISTSQSYQMSRRSAEPQGAARLEAGGGQSADRDARRDHIERPAGINPCNRSLRSRLQFKAGPKAGSPAGLPTPRRLVAAGYALAFCAAIAA